MKEKQDEKDAAMVRQKTRRDNRKAEKDVNYIRELVILKNGIKYKKRKLVKENYCYIGQDVEFPYAVADLFKSIKDFTKKKLFAMYLDNKQRLVSFQHIITGATLSGLDEKKIFTGALFAKAKSVILVSNSPGGGPKLSDEELEQTEKIRSIGKSVGVDVRDHVVLSQESYCSALEGKERLYRVHDNPEHRFFIVNVMTKDEFENLYGQDINQHDCGSNRISEHAAPLFVEDRTERRKQGVAIMDAAYAQRRTDIFKGR